MVNYRLDVLISILLYENKRINFQRKPKLRGRLFFQDCRLFPRITALHAWIVLKIEETEFCSTENRLIYY